MSSFGCGRAGLEIEIGRQQLSGAISCIGVRFRHKGSFNANTSDGCPAHTNGARGLP
jgi:hypothetical protein